MSLFNPSDVSIYVVGFSRRKRSRSLGALIACCKSIVRKNDWRSQEDNKESREDSCWVHAHGERAS